MKNSSTLKLSLVTASATAALLLAGCGLAETSAVAASQGAAAAEQVKQGKEMEEKVQRDIEAAEQAAADARAKAEAENQ
jgi:hypothetical protein